MNKIIVIIIVLVVLVTTVVYWQYFYEPQEEVAVGESLDTVCQSVETTENATEKYTIKTEVCRTGIEEIDSEIDIWINEKVLYTVENAEQLKELGSAAKPELLASSEVFSYSDTIKSLNMIVYEYQGGAHGMTNYMTWVFNMGTGEIFDLDSFFRESSNPLSVIYPILKEKLMATSEHMEEGWVDRGTGEENFENYERFVLDGNNLLFIFPAYQVGPYAIGLQEVSIPLSELSTILDSKFFQPTAECQASSRDECPMGCIVCPPCEICSSMGCDLAEFCQSIGFDADWYEMVKTQQEAAE